MNRGRISPRELAYCGLFGAGALLLPVLFHVVNLGKALMPMYLPLVALAFFVRPAPAIVTALLVPILSGAVTGMPPFFPPVAPCMAVELAVMAGGISTAGQRWPEASPWAVLIPVLLLGRVVYAGLIYACALVIDLPAPFMAGLSFVSGWPGLLLMMIVVPSVVKAGRTIARPGAMRERNC